MTAKQSFKYQLRAAQCGFAFEALYTIFWGYFGHNLPPASPNLSAPDLAAISRSITVQSSLGTRRRADQRSVDPAEVATPYCNIRWLTGRANSRGRRSISHDLIGCPPTSNPRRTVQASYWARAGQVLFVRAITRPTRRRRGCQTHGQTSDRSG
jgi:hypothetical protein